MSDDAKSINWNSVISNAVSTLVAAVFVGAAMIVWNAATTIDERIENATIGLSAAQKTSTNEIAKLYAEIELLKSQLDSHDEAIREQITAANVSRDTPIALPKAKVFDPKISDVKEANVKRIFEEYEKNRSMIQQQAPLR